MNMGLDCYYYYREGFESLNKSNRLETTTTFVLVAASIHINRRMQVAERQRQHQHGSDLLLLLLLQLQPLVSIIAPRVLPVPLFPQVGKIHRLHASGHAVEPA